MSQLKADSISKLTFIWAILILLTISTAIIGYFKLSGFYIVGFILLTVFIKGTLIIDYYMGLRNVRGFWRITMLGFVSVIPIIALTVYYFSQVTVVG